MYVLGSFVSILDAKATTSNTILYPEDLHVLSPHFFVASLHFPILSTLPPYHHDILQSNHDPLLTNVSVF